MQVNGFNQQNDFHISTTFAIKTKKPGIAAWLFLKRY
jgi:hypothetical protein